MNNADFLRAYSTHKKRCFASIFYDLFFSIASLIGFLVYHWEVHKVDPTNFGFISLTLLLRLATPVLLYLSLFRNRQKLCFVKLYILCLSFSAFGFACLSVSSSITLTTLFDNKQSMYVRHVRETVLPFLSVVIPLTILNWILCFVFFFQIFPYYRFLKQSRVKFDDEDY